MISKELLAKVLNRDIESFNIDMYGNIDYKVFNDYGSCMNIYELAFRCKDWALTKDCQLISCIKDEKKSLCDIYSNILKCNFTHYADTEQKAIIKACEWILNETNS